LGSSKNFYKSKNGFLRICGFSQKKSNIVFANDLQKENAKKTAFFCFLKRKNAKNNKCELFAKRKMRKKPYFLFL